MYELERLQNLRQEIFELMWRSLGGIHTLESVLDDTDAVVHYIVSGVVDDTIDTTKN